MRHPADYLSYAIDGLARSLSGAWGTARLRAKAPLLGVALGSGARAWGKVLLRRAPGSRIEIGNGAVFVSTSRRSAAASIWAPCRLVTHMSSASIVLGDGVSANGASLTARSTSIEVGDGTMIGPNVIVVDFDGHAQWPAQGRLASPDTERDAPVRIGQDVWLGMGSLVLKGVHVGEGSVIGAGSVVTSDVPSGVLAAGVPARVIRRLDER